jgi:hypothetical protein
MMTFLRDLDIENEKDETGKVIALRDTYSFRHRFASALQSTQHMPDSTAERRRYLCGHAGRDVHERTYLDHPPRLTKPILDAALIDPTEACGANVA